ncbi:MBL fold metallo-hydrolase [Bacillus licheniformis]|nr:MBL fold metallo-hydrolase [Bacillus licheniformis]
MKSELAEQGLSLSDIDQVVLTHHHADHAGLLNEFPAEVKSLAIRSMNRISVKSRFIENKSPFYIPVSTIRRSRRYEAARPYHKASYRYSCNRTLTETVSEGGQIEGLDGWRVLETPGHAASHIVLYNEELGSMLGETCC